MVAVHLAFLFLADSAVFGQYTPAYFTSVEQRDRWVADVREAIRKEEKDLADTERTAAKWLANANKNPTQSGRESDLSMYKSWAKLAEDSKRRLEALKEKLRNIPGIRDLEAERQEQQRLADERAAANRRAQEQQFEQARQFEAAAAKQFQRQERAQGIANALMQGFNNMQEQNRKWEDFQEARRERERREAAEERAYQYARQQEAAQSAQANAHVAPPPVIPTTVPEPEPYNPPSLGGYLSDDAKQFGAEVVVETVTILAGQFNDGASNLRDAASGGIQGLADDFLDSAKDMVKDAVKDAAMDFLSEDKQLFIRAMNAPLSILSRNWDAIQDSYNSLIENHIKNPLDDFTVESVVNQATGNWPSGSR